MKRSEMIRLVLKHSCSLVNEEQVIQNLEILEKYGMLPPSRGLTYKEIEDLGPEHMVYFTREGSVNKWEPEDG